MILFIIHNPILHRKATKCFSWDIVNTMKLVALYLNFFSRKYKTIQSFYLICQALFYTSKVMSLSCELAFKLYRYQVNNCNPNSADKLKYSTYGLTQVTTKTNRPKCWNSTENHRVLVVSICWQITPANTVKALLKYFNNL